MLKENEALDLYQKFSSGEKFQTYKKVLFCIMFLDFLKVENENEEIIKLKKSFEKMRDKGLYTNIDLMVLNYIADKYSSFSSIPIEIKISKKKKISYFDILKELNEINVLCDSLVLKYKSKLVNFFTEKSLDLINKSLM